VCLLICQLGLGGTEKQVVLLAGGLRARGVDARVLVMFEEVAREDALHAAGIPVVHLGFRRQAEGWRTLPANIAAFSRLVGYLRRARTQVLHAFLSRSHVLALPAARLAGVPVFVACRRNMGQSAKDRRLVPALVRAANRKADLLIANAQAVAQLVRSREGIPQDKIAVVYNGIPDSAFDPVSPASLLADRPVVLCVANLRFSKGQRFLLDAVATLQRHGLASTLVLVGEGPERAGLKRLADQLGIDVRFLGARTDVEGLMARADAVVLPSLHEGMSNAVMEAMAAGRPVVATDVGGTGELLRGRGVLVPPADADALADALTRILTDPALAERLGKSARDWSFANLRADTMVDQHIRIYRELLEGRCAVWRAGVVPVSRCRRRSGNEKRRPR
jgi:glycosyltransferase involved in cell wall biosynthesis